MTKHAQKWKKKTQTECLRQHEKENFSSCAIFYVRPLEQKDGKTNGISSFELFSLIFFDSCGISCRYSDIAVLTAHLNEIFILVSLLLALFLPFLFVLCANNSVQSWKSCSTKKHLILAKVHPVCGPGQHNRYVSTRENRFFFLALWMHIGIVCELSAQPDDAD